MDITKILVDAAASVDAADIPEDLRKAAFEKAVDLLASSHEAPEALEVGERVAGRRIPQDKHPNSQSPTLGTLADRLGVSLDDVREVFHMAADGTFEVVVGPNLLDSTNSGGTKQLALLIVGGRQLAGLEDWTGVNTVREVCELYNRYDMPNFTKAIKAIDSYFSFRGRASKRELRLKRPGEAALKELVLQLTTTGE